MAKFIPTVWCLVDRDVVLPPYVDDKTLVKGFNETNDWSQCPVTPEQAISNWQYLERLKNPLTSPVVRICTTGPSDANCTDSDWLDKFMALAQARGKRVDVIGVDDYTCDTNKLAADMDALIAKYHRPVVLFETNCMPWNGNAVTFVDEALPKIAPKLAGYAWFPLQTTHEYQNFQPLANSDGSLTELGNHFRDSSRTSSRPRRPTR